MSSKSFFNISDKNIDIKFYFITRTGEPASQNSNDCLHLCFTQVNEHLDSPKKVKWISEEQCVNFKSKLLSSTHVFVTTAFVGAAFEYLQTTDALLLGPRCVLSCLVNNIDLPAVEWPIFSLTMQDLTVCISGLRSNEKAELGKLIRYMGGVYVSDSLHSSVTHLVTNTVLSEKYEKAATNAIKIMKPQWIQKLWNDCQHRDIDADGSEYRDCTVRPFFNLTFTTTSLTTAVKDELKRVIEDNDGTLIGAFQAPKISFLIMDENGMSSQKYKAALQTRKECIKPAWIHDSAMAGYALALDEYKIDTKQKVNPSTPCKMSDERAFNPNWTNMSEIVGNSTVNETVLSSRSTNFNVVEKSSSYKLLLEKIKLKDVKMAGPFLDCCNIFLCGFTSQEKEKLCKILNFGRAVRLDEYSSQVTHIVVGAPTKRELNMLLSIKESVSILTFDWLISSINGKAPAKENDFCYNLCESSRKSDESVAGAASPSSKKSIRSMTHSFRQPMPKKGRKLEFNDKTTTAAENVEEQTLVSRYLENVAPEPANVERKTENAVIPSVLPLPQPAVSHESASKNVDTQFSFASNTETEDVSFLVDTTFCIDGFGAEMNVEFTNQIINAGGKVIDINEERHVDFLLVPVDILALNDMKIQPQNIVTELWLDDSMQANEPVAVEYFHRPIILDENADKPLETMTIVFSTYTGHERVFLQSLAQFLGAIHTSSYARHDRPLLICPTADGNKYNGAIKWNLPIVTAEWLLECYKRHRKCEMRDYLVGESVLPADDRQPRDHSDVIENNYPVATDKSQSTDHITNDEFEQTSEEELPVVCAEKNNFPTVAVSFEQFTPVLKHRRLTEIGGVGTSRRDSSPFLSQSPQTPYDHNRTIFCEDLSTPERDLVYNMLKEIDDNTTPETRRRNKAMVTPETPVTPEECKTPWMQKRHNEFWEKRKLPHCEPSPHTPWDEWRKKFWKNALGDNYESPTVRLEPSPAVNADDDVDCVPPTPGQLANKNKMPTEFAIDVDDECVPPTQEESNVQTVRSTDVVSNDNYAKKLSDFIKNRERPTVPDYISLPDTEETQPTNFNKIATAGNAGTQEIGWRDPDDFFQSERFTGKKCTDRMQHKGTPIFSISCSSETLKQTISTQILSLNGHICQNDISYDPTCTHVLCEKTTRSQRIFSAIAAGKWILSFKYISDSVEAGYFLNEELYEWGNPKNENGPEMDMNFGAIIRAAYRWRTKISQAIELDCPPKAGAFDGFRVILHCSKPDRFKALLEAGGGTVLNVQEPYRLSADALSATHCLNNSKEPPLSKEDKQAFAHGKVMCATIMYLQEYITSDLVTGTQVFAFR